MTEPVKQELKKQIKDIFGVGFIYQVLKMFLLDPLYFKAIRSKIKPEYFAIDGVASEELVRFMANSVDAGIMYTADSIKMDCKLDADGDEAKNYKYGYVFGEIEKCVIPENEVESIKKHLECQLVKLKIAELTINLNREMFFERYKDKPELLLQKGFNYFLNELNMDGDDMGTFADEDIHNALAKNIVEYIPTGEEKIDYLTGGGATRKSVAAFIAPPGWGKSTFSSLLGLEMAKRGYKVLHIFFEDDKNMIWRKYYSRLLGIEINNVEGDTIEKQILERPDYNRIKENVCLIHWKTGLKTAEDIEQLYMSRMYNGFQADVVIIDYFACLKMSVNPTKDNFLAEESTMRKLETMANKRNILIWTMIQANRMATSKNNTDGIAQNIEGSKLKKNILSTILAIGPDRDNPGYALFEVDKVRNGGKLCAVHRVKYYTKTVSFDWSDADIEYRNIQDEEENGAIRTDDELTISDDDWEKNFTTMPVDTNNTFYLSKD